MKVRLYEKEAEPKEIRLSDVTEKTFCVALSGVYENHILYRPSDNASNFALDITGGTYWSTNPKTDSEINPLVRILQPGELIEVTE